MQPNINHEPSIRFGCFELKLRSEELVRDGIAVKLPPQPFKVLAILVQNAGRLVTREEIRQKIWGDNTFVDFDKGLNFCIKQIREALGDHAQSPEYVETLPRRGYRFIPSVDEDTTAAVANPKVVGIHPVVAPNHAMPLVAADQNPTTKAGPVRKYRREIAAVSVLALLAVPLYTLRGRMGSEPASSGGIVAVNQQPVDSSKTVTGKTVTVRKIQASWALVRDVRGSYEMHPEVFAEMLAYVGSNFRAVGDSFGVYPMDPDAAKQGTLRWQAGLRITPGEPLGLGNSLPLITSVAKSSQEFELDKPKFNRPRSPYRIVLLEEIEAAVLESSVEETPQDGLSMMRWMAENGYVQVGATRMEYLSHDKPANKIPTRIIVPIQKRASGLTVPHDRVSGT